LRARINIAGAVELVHSRHMLHKTREFIRASGGHAQNPRWGLRARLASSAVRRSQPEQRAVCCDRTDEGPVRAGSIAQPAGTARRRK